MIICPRCGHIGVRDSYFRIVKCISCDWWVSVDDYEARRLKPKPGTVKLTIRSPADKKKAVGTTSRDS